MTDLFLAFLLVTAVLFSLLRIAIGVVDNQVSRYHRWLWIVATLSFFVLVVLFPRPEQVTGMLMAIVLVDIVLMFVWLFAIERVVSLSRSKRTDRILWQHDITIAKDTLARRSNWLLFWLFLTFFGLALFSHYDLTTIWLALVLLISGLIVTVREEGAILKRSNQLFLILGGVTFSTVALWQNRPHYSYWGSTSDYVWALAQAASFLWLVVAIIVRSADYYHEERMSISHQALIRSRIIHLNVAKMAFVIWLISVTTFYWLKFG